MAKVHFGNKAMMIARKNRFTNKWLSHEMPFPLTLEVLEDRTTPTILFSPKYGAEVATDHGGFKLANDPVYLIFWGSYWSTPRVSPSVATLDAAARNILTGPYLSGLSQYGAGGVADIRGVIDPS